MRLVCPLLAALALAAPVGALALDYRAQADVASVENISRTSLPTTAKDAVVYSLDLGATHARQLAPAWTLIGGVDAGWEHVPDFDALNRLNLAARATLRRKFGLGALAPVLDASVGLARAEFREDGRSGWRSTGGLRLAKRLNESWRVGAIAEWESFSASAAPFDIHHRRLGADATWDASDRWRLSAGASRLKGQIVANATGSIWSQAISGGLGAVVSSYYNSVPWQVTGTFGPDWVAYRVEATADFLWGEAAYRISERTSAIVRRETVKVINRIDVRYDTEIWSLGLVHRF